MLLLSFQKVSFSQEFQKRLISPPMEAYSFLNFEAESSPKSLGKEGVDLGGYLRFSMFK